MASPENSEFALQLKNFTVRLACSVRLNYSHKNTEYTAKKCYTERSGLATPTRSSQSDSGAQRLLRDGVHKGQQSLRLKHSCVSTITIQNNQLISQRIENSIEQCYWQLGWASDSHSHPQIQYRSVESRTSFAPVRDISLLLSLSYDHSHSHFHTLTLTLTLIHSPVPECECKWWVIQWVRCPSVSPSGPSGSSPLHWDPIPERGWLTIIQ